MDQSQILEGQNNDSNYGDKSETSFDDDASIMVLPPPKIKKPDLPPRQKNSNYISKPPPVPPKPEVNVIFHVVFYCKKITISVYFKHLIKYMSTYHDQNLDNDAKSPDENNGELPGSNGLNVEVPTRRPSTASKSKEEVSKPQRMTDEEVVAELGKKI